MADRRHDTGEVRPPSPPISAGRDTAAQALRAFADVTAAAAPPEERAWRSVEQRLESGGRSRFRMGHAGWASLALGATAVALFIARWPSEQRAAEPSPSATVASSQSAAAAAPPVDEHPTIPRRPSTPTPAHTLALGRVPHPLPSGATELVGEAVVTLSPAASAAATADAAKTIVRLDRGSATFDVAPRRSGRAFRVEAGAYAFEVLGTVFEVSRNDKVALTVREGRVAVLRGQRRVAIVNGGGRWTSPAPRAARPPLASDKLHADPLARCVDDVVAGDAASAIRCYEAVARQGLAASEPALVMAARLRAESGDATGAVDLLRTHAERFPDGRLFDEITLMMVELLPAVGRAKEALALSGAALASDSGQRNRSELLLQRGHIYRRLGECASALGEYRAAAEGPRSRAADEGAFFHALCLQVVGRLTDARRAYWEYLLRPAAARSAEARRRVTFLE